MAERQFYKVTIEGWLPFDPHEAFFIPPVDEYDLCELVRNLEYGDGVVTGVFVSEPISERAARTDDSMMDEKARVHFGLDEEETDGEGDEEPKTD